MRRFILVVACLVAVTLGAVLALGTGAPPPVPKPGDVVTGHDLGFRVEKVGSDYVVGTFVVRINGTWTETAQPSLPRVIPAKP